ncbi:MAG: hypothetical protein ABSB74_07945 [Tepidisphaeraceae bacterium]
MCSALAFAESGDPNATNLPIILGGLFILAVIALLAFALIFISRARGHRQTELITVATIFWALAAAGSLLYAGESQMDWSHQYALRLETGYLDPQDTSDAPRLPWGIWSGLGVAYGAMLLWSFSQKHAEAKQGENDNAV